MTRIEQTVRLAQRVADRMTRGPIDEAEFYRWGLNRQHYNNQTFPSFGLSDIRVTDVTLWHQVQYAQAHCTPDDLERQAADLTAAVSA